MYNHPELDAYVDGIEAQEEYACRRIRTASMAGAAALGVLQVADILLTRRFQSYGLPEGNKLMAPLLDSPAAMILKIMLVVVLAVCAYKRPRLSVLCGVWLAVGYYVMTCYINWEVVQALGAIL